MHYLVTVQRTSMGVRINLPTVHFEREILRWAEERLHAPKMGKENGRITTERGDPYYAHMPTERSFIFHKSYENDLLTIIHRCAMGYNFKITVEFFDIGHTEPYRCTFENYGFDLIVTDEASRFFYQNEVVDRAIQPERFQIIFAVQTGRGKCARHGTLVRIPGGWKLIEDIRVGDVVIGGDGKPTNVIGVYPQGTVDMYTVTFDDGRSSVVCGEHLWQSFYVNTTSERRWRVRDTLEMKRLISMPNPRVYIPLPEPEETTEKEFLIHPYLLGVLLGDGTFGESRVSWAKNDVEVAEKIKRLVPDAKITSTKTVDKVTCWNIIGGGAVNRTRDAVRTYGLTGKRAWEKFIPVEYMEGSIEQRWELLRGLMDTDGTVNKDGGQPSYTSTSMHLALQVADLFRSLGGIASISSRIPTYTCKGEKLQGRRAYTVFMRHKQPSLLFSLPRKKALCRDDGQYADILKLRVKSIEPCGRDLGTCITVDNADSLFVLDQWVVTHNTKSSQKVMVKRGVRTTLVHRPSYVDKWIYDCCVDPTGLREDRKHVHVVKGVDAVYELYELGKSGELDRRGIKIIILPTVTLMLFLKEWMASAHSNPVVIEEFYNVIGVGEVIMDEIHEQFRLVYLSAIMMNPPKLVEMSATLKPSKAKKFIADRYLERFPLENRVSVPYIPVVDVRAVIYNIDNKKLQGYAAWMAPYNHKLVEAKIMKMDMEESYFDMVYDVMARSFLKDFQAGQKALVMFVTVEMCERFLAYARRRLDASEHAHLMIVKYNAGDSYDTFMMADIGVSTPGKSGTAIDIPGLVHAYITPPISDDQLNEQIAGRPRETKQWDLTPKVWFFHCAAVPKHMKYLDDRRDTLKEIVKSFTSALSNYVIRSKHASPPAAFASVASVRGFKPFKLRQTGPSRLPRRRNRR